MLKIKFIKKGECIQTIQDPTSSYFYSVKKISQNELATGHIDGFIRIWNIHTAKFVRVMNGHLDLVNNLHLMASGGELVSSSFDSTIKIWNIESGICFKTLIGHTSAVNF